MSYTDRTYADGLEEVLLDGEDREDRTGTGTLSIFGLRGIYSADPNTFPLLTSKRVYWKGVVEELLWFLRGETNIKSLQDANVHIWDEWADENGNLGPVYGAQWRSWQSHNLVYDQIWDVIDQIKNNPTSRRMIVNAWNVGQLDDMALPPCHMMFQFYVRDGKYLDCQLYQRSADMFLGVPFNIASYALLINIIAHMTGLEAGTLIHVIGDAHIYKNHLDQVKQQLSRIAKIPPAPILKILCDPKDDPADYTFEDFELVDYNPLPAIKAPVAV